MSQFKVIAFVGKKGSGKSTAASILQEIAESEYEISRKAFSAPIKLFCEKLYPQFKMNFYTPELKEVPFYENNALSARKVMTQLAKAVRTIDTKAFSEAMSHNILSEFSSLAEKPKMVIIDDVRFEEELDMLEKLNDYHGVDVTFIYMNPEPDTLFKKLQRTLSRDVNPSERGLDHRYHWILDLKIENREKDLEQLRSTVSTIYKNDFIHGFITKHGVQ